LRCRCFTGGSVLTNRTWAFSCLHLARHLTRTTRTCRIQLGSFAIWLCVFWATYRIRNQLQM
jgi:hypothetical protein